MLLVAVFTTAGTVEPAAALAFEVEGVEVIAAACELAFAFAVPTVEAAMFVLEGRSLSEDAWVAEAEAFAAVVELPDTFVGTAVTAAACEAATPFTAAAAFA